MTKENTHLCDFNVICDVGAIDLCGCRINQMKNKCYGIFLEYVVLNLDICFIGVTTFIANICLLLFMRIIMERVYFLSAPKNCYSCVKIYL